MLLPIALAKYLDSESASAWITHKLKDKQRLRQKLRHSWVMWQVASGEWGVASSDVECRDTECKLSIIMHQIMNIN